jgi:hypothetical protein
VNSLIIIAKATESRLAIPPGLRHSILIEAPALVAHLAGGFAARMIRAQPHQSPETSLLFRRR